MAEKKKSRKRKVYKEETVLGFLNKGKRGGYYVAPNVYIEVKGPNSGVWHTRFQFEKKRYQKKLGVFGDNNPYLMGYDGAIQKSIEIQRALAANEHPLERNHTNVFTLNQLHDAHLESAQYSYDKQKEIYTRYFKNSIGLKPVCKITREDLEKTIKSIVNTGYSSLAIKAIVLLSKPI